MPNRLINEKSPYLLQHAHNPVDWYPWGPEAFETARRENKPLFLSVGYATCHWCHVMERESFEDAEAAAVLNRSFVCVKVDREERPDIDTLYMAACQLVTGGGGWPMTIVMTPDKKPFFAGTYIPKQSAMGRLGLIELCNKITELWQQSPDRVLESADALAGHLADAFVYSADPADPDPSVITQAVEATLDRQDTQFGGFDTAPKFPMAHRLTFLLGAHARDKDERVLAATTHALTAMRLGGLWDHVGFGFHRYSTDRQWLLPHFEKMLYDQAFLAMAYLEGYTATGNPLFSQTAREIFTYVLRDMTGAQGGFFTAEDADSEGEEGKFYVWSQAEFDAHLASDEAGTPWGRILNMQPEGNFLEEATRHKTGTNILHLTDTWDAWAQRLQVPTGTLARQWEALRQRLFATRVKRIPPLKDDKILTDWNGMMIAALAQGALALDRTNYLDGACKAAEFILERMRDANGRLLHRYREGQVAISATANDYAFFIMGLIALYRADNDRHWLERATDLQGRMNLEFHDGDHGGFFLTGADAPDLPVRPKEIYDGAIPSANAVTLHNLLHLGDLTGQPQWRAQARDLIRAFGGSVRRQPVAYLHMLDGWRRYSAAR
jgi:uncharacterized protein